MHDLPLDEIPIDKLVTEIMRRQMSYEQGYCPYCKRKFENIGVMKICTTCKFGDEARKLYYPGCLASLKAIV